MKGGLKNGLRKGERVAENHLDERRHDAARSLNAKRQRLDVKQEVVVRLLVRPLQGCSPGQQHCTQQPRPG